MRFALVTQMREDGTPVTVVPVISGDLADAVLNRLDDGVRAACETAIRNAFAAEEQAVRSESIRLGPEHE